MAKRLRERKRPKMPAAGPRITVSDAVLVAAFRRGVSTRQLSRALGVSVQRVQQRLKRNGLAAGQYRKQPTRGPRLPRACQVCGHVDWVTPSELHTRKYCSPKCRRAAQRPRKLRIPEEAILKAIELRDAGWAWERISSELGWPPQSLLRRVWKLLHERGELTEDRVVALLHDRRDRLHKPRWEWLVRKTGLRPERSEPLVEAA
jgi:transposase